MNPRLALALKLLEAGLVESAAIPVAQALERDPDDPRAHHLAGLIARRGGDGALALAAFTRGLAVAADDAPLRIERAGLLLDLGRAEEALADLAVALALAPDHQAVLSTQGRALIDLGRPGEALAPLRRARPRLW
ncbi:tetratricopeptide repeat protein, partial [Rhodospirillum rubrum]|uniref:tetratricopeptide repeat protein n=1 Tax=Rhodospirillum rubrum TaxID=1085 RepID=UPI0028AB069F